MGTFQDILPMILGAGAGLLGPRVGPSMAQGVAMWHASQDRKTRNADREELKEYRKRSEARADRSEGRTEVRFEQGQEDREYTLGRRPQSEAREDFTFEEMMKRAQRGDITFQQQQEERPGDIAYRDWARGNAKENAAFRDKQEQAWHADRQRSETERMGWTEAATHILEQADPAFLNSPSVAAYIQAEDHKGLVGLHNSWIKGQTQGRKEQAAEISSLQDDRLTFIRRLGEIDGKRKGTDLGVDSYRDPTLQTDGSAVDDKDIVYDESDPFYHEETELIRQLVETNSRLRQFGVNPGQFRTNFGEGGGGGGVVEGEPDTGKVDELVNKY